MAQFGHKVGIKMRMQSLNCNAKIKKNKKVKPPKVLDLTLIIVIMFNIILFKT